jgi:hypothetical protein
MPRNKPRKTPTPQVGQNSSVPAFYEGQKCKLPDHYVTRDRAIEMIKAGEARSRERGTSILILSPKPEGRADTHRESVKSRWAVVGQTAKPFTDMHSLGVYDELASTEECPVYRKPAPGPGFPRYALA